MPASLQCSACPAVNCKVVPVCVSAHYEGSYRSSDSRSLLASYLFSPSLLAYYRRLTADTVQSIRALLALYAVYVACNGCGQARLISPLALLRYRICPAVLSTAALCIQLYAATVARPMRILLQLRRPTAQRNDGWRQTHEH